MSCQKCSVQKILHVNIQCKVLLTKQQQQSLVPGRYSNETVASFIIS